MGSFCFKGSVSVTQDTKVPEICRMTLCLQLTVMFRTLKYLSDGEKGGEGFSGTTIKDTWTKPRRVESGREVVMAGVWGEWWEVNVDNCT